MRAQDLALQRDKYKHLSDDEWRWLLQQVDGRERTAEKLPTFAAMEDWWYPVRLSCEQCSSELAAKYKASLIANRQKQMVDLTGGYGVDTFFLSELFDHTDYVEQDTELCRIAKHNFANKPITIHNTTAEDFLKNAGLYDLIFLDPARRNNYGGKVFRLEDCTPNVVELLPNLLSHLSSDGHLLLKLSPMLDITQAVNQLSAVPWDVYVVAIKNEVKEVLLLSGGNGIITTIDLDKKNQVFVFTKEEEKISSYTLPLSSFNYLYEPNAAILKAGAYKLIAERFGLYKLDANTHLYCSDEIAADFPGRIWKIKEQISNHKIAVNHANILTRNYPLTPEQLKKKLHLQDGGTDFVIGCRVNNKPTLFLAERTENIHSES